jgi:hypothetical protein
MKTKHTAENTEVSAVKATRKIQRNAKAWENLGVKFRKSEFIGFSLDGKIGSQGQPKLAWSAWYKGTYLTGGGREIEDLVEYMNEHAQRYLFYVAKRNSRK